MKTLCPAQTSFRWLAAVCCLGMLLPSSAWSAPEFFVFDNGVGRGSWTPEKQAATLKELGYDGISYNYTTPADLAVWLTTLKTHGLKLYGLYVHTFVDKAEQYDPAFKEAIKLLKGTDTVIWMTLRRTGTKGDCEAQAVKLVQDIADQALENRLRVALYPHAGFYVSSASDAVRILKHVQRANVGGSLNLCHEFLSKRGEFLDETLREAAPYLTLVSINGVKVQKQEYILRLDQGDFDLGAFLKKLRAAGYRGPIGLQCFNVPGNVTENLKANIVAWKNLASSLDQP